MRISINSDVMYNPQYGLPPSISALFFVARGAQFCFRYTMSTAVLCIDVVPISDECRVSRVSNSYLKTT